MALTQKQHAALEYFDYNIDDIKTVEDIENDLRKRYKDKVLLLHPDRNIKKLKHLDKAFVYKNWGDMCEHYAYIQGLCERKPKNQNKLLHNIKVYHKAVMKTRNSNNNDDTEPSVSSIYTSDVENYLENQNNNK